MEAVPAGEGDPASGIPRRASYVLDGDGAWIAEARRLAAAFLTRAQAEDALPVSARAMEVTQLVVSELVANARKYAPGPVRLDLRIAGDALEVMVRDGSTALPVAGAGTRTAWAGTAWRSCWPSPAGWTCSPSRPANASRP
ncbi:hypothetical protein SHIRM173S_04786 [Streptomyces hirsutus]